LKWGDLGDGPRGITFSGGNLFVANSDNQIQKRSPTGTLLLAFGTGGATAGAMVNPKGVAIGPSGDIYATDSFPERTNTIVQRFNSSGVFQSAWGTQGGGNGQFQGAGGVAVDSGGNVYVVDTGNHRVQKFNATGTFITKWGTNGSATGQFSGPVGIAVDSSDNIYVADAGNNRIQKFSSTGTFLMAFGTSGTADGQFSFPQGVSVAADGTIYVADTLNNRIQTFTSAGVWISTCGTNLMGGSLDGEFSGPQDVAVDPSGDNFYVADTGNDRVQKFGEGAAAPPIANAGADQTVECAGATTAVNLDGSASTAGSGSITSYAWKEGATSLGTGQMLTVNLATGTHTITLTVTDSASGTDTDDVVVTVVDTLAPSITCPSNIVVSLPMNSTATSMVVNYPAVTAVDACSSSVTVNSSPASGSTFPVGTTTVNATADDGAGHTSTCSFTVTVAYNFAGFFQPVDNLPALNVVQAGRAIPVKFSLSGFKGLGIFAPDSPESGPITCNSSDPATDLEETVNAGGSSLSYNATTDQYNYVWKTEQSWVGTCRQLVVTLNDGSVHRANFKFK
jgi:DNA-binding beta-propeller fold protein YncE